MIELPRLASLGDAEFIEADLDARRLVVMCMGTLGWSLEGRTAVDEEDEDFRLACFLPSPAALEAAPAVAVPASEAMAAGKAGERCMDGQ